MYIYISIHVSIYACNDRLLTNAYVDTQKVFGGRFEHSYARTRTHVHTHTNTHTHAHTHTYTYVYIHTHIHTQTHAHILSLCLSLSVSFSVSLSFCFALSQVHRHTLSHTHSHTTHGTLIGIERGSPRKAVTLWGTVAVGSGVGATNSGISSISRYTGPKFCSTTGAASSKSAGCSFSCWKTLRGRERGG